MPARYAAPASAPDEKASCAPQLKAQACRPSTYVDEVTRRRHPDVVLMPPREDPRAGKDEGDRDTAPEVKDAKKTKESSRRVRKRVHFAEDEGYASATGTPALVNPKQLLQHDKMSKIKVQQVCGEHGDDRGRVLVKSGSARVPKPVHKEEPSHQPSRTTTSRKATSQRTSKTKKKPRTEKPETVQDTGGSYRNQYGNIVFEDFF